MKENEKTPVNSKAVIMVLGVVAITEALVALLLVIYMFFRH